MLEYFDGSHPKLTSMDGVGECDTSFSWYVPSAHIDSDCPNLGRRFSSYSADARSSYTTWVRSTSCHKAPRRCTCWEKRGGSSCDQTKGNFKAARVNHKQDARCGSSSCRRGKHRRNILIPVLVVRMKTPSTVKKRGAQTRGCRGKRCHGSCESRCVELRRIIVTSKRLSSCEWDTVMFPSRAAWSHAMLAERARVLQVYKSLSRRLNGLS